MTRRALVTGATGFVGGRLASALGEAGWEVRGMVRDRAGARARRLERTGVALHEGDVLRSESLRGAGQGADVAYYLIHSMGRGGDGDFGANERAAAASFARMARAEGIERVVYLGGLGDRPQSRHLRSRHETALALAEHGPPLTYFRAGMVVGAQSESYRTLRYLVQRLPAMIAPAWLKNATQPIAIDDTLRYLVQAPSIMASSGREIQIGGPDVLSYGEMLDRMAAVLDLRRRPRVPVPLLTPWLSSLWIGLVTPVDAGSPGRWWRGSPCPRSSPIRPAQNCSTTCSRSASTRRYAAPSPRIPSSGRASKTARRPRGHIHVSKAAAIPPSSTRRRSLAPLTASGSRSGRSALSRIAIAADGRR
jgi:uncharacterized protein YbjT (DUF2867 family)